MKPLISFYFFDGKYLLEISKEIPKSFLVYLGVIFYGDQPMYPQDPVVLASSQIDERHVQDDASLLSKNISTA